MGNLAILGEEGYWEQPSWSRNPDDEQWIRTGWCARTYDGATLFRHKEQEPVKVWLSEQGYQDTGDGAHYRQGNLCPECGKSGTRSLNTRDDDELQLYRCPAGHTYYVAQ